MAEFNTDLYTVKGVFTPIETDTYVIGFYYQNEEGKHFIIEEESFERYEVNPYTLCRNTGLEIKNSSYIPYEYDVVQYNEPMRSNVLFGYLEFNQLTKGYVLVTNSETNQYRTLDKCCNLLYTGRNVLVSDEDMKWFVEYSKREYEKTKSHTIDNSYCPSKFRR
jgi:hypothetical protein